MDATVLVAIIGCASAVIVAVIQVVWGARKKGLKEIESHKEAIKHIKGFEGLSFTFDEHIKIATGAQELFATTEVDRFFTLVAFNGKDKARWVTALIHFEQGEWVVGKYENFEIDDHYNGLLKKMRMGEEVCFTVESLPSGVVIRDDVYMPEGIECSKWLHLSEKMLPDGVVQVLFCSASSHTVKMYSQASKAKIKSFADMYRGIIRGVEAREAT